jgi:hypothetical protein
MDIEAFTRREKMLQLREELLAVEEDRLAGRAGVTLDELDGYLDSMIDEIDEAEKTVRRPIAKIVVERANTKVIQSKKAGLSLPYREKTSQEIKAAFQRACVEASTF